MDNDGQAMILLVILEAFDSVPHKQICMASEVSANVA